MSKFFSVHLKELQRNWWSNISNVLFILTKHVYQHVANIIFSNFLKNFCTKSSNLVSSVTKFSLEDFNWHFCSIKSTVENSVSS